MSEHKESLLTGKIIGIAMKVHTALGPGFQEKIYHKALIHQLTDEGYNAEYEKEFNVVYNGRVVGNFRVDLLVNNKVIIELKAVTGEMPKLFQTQTISYLKASSIEIGLLLNFGNQSLEIKRFGNYHDYIHNTSV